nr:hypothetical protein [Tanacetum cinerariifolium]
MEPKGHDNRSRDVTRKTVPVETPNSSALVSCDGLRGYDWSDQAEEGPTNYALMAYSTSSASSSNSKNASKSLNKIIECQIMDNCKKEIGYNAVPPPHTGLFSPLKLDLSYTGLEELFNEPKTEKSKDNSNDVEPESIRKDSDAPIIEDWRMRIEQYIQIMDYALWDVIENGNSILKTQTVNNVETFIPPTTAEEKLQKRNEVKARSTLMMGLPNEHQLKFNSFKDANSLLEAIEKRFGGNDATKKTQGNILKQQYENFSGSGSKSLDQTFDKLQKLVSQLELLGKVISQEDINLKFLRSLPSEWESYIANEVNTASSQVNAASSLNIDNLSDAVICAFLASQPNSSHLVNEDLEQIHLDDLEKMDLKGHFARECMEPKGHDNRSRDVTRKTVPIEIPNSSALVNTTKPIAAVNAAKAKAKHKAVKGKGVMLLRPQHAGAKTTSWNEFSRAMASAIICLANNQKFNFSKYILTNLVNNLEAGVPFYMFSRFIQVFVNHQLGDMSHHKGIFVNPSLTKKRKHKPRRKQRMETEVSPTKTNTEEHVPTPFNDPLPSGNDRMQLKELIDLCTNLSNKVLDMENEVIEMKSSHKAKIEELESRESSKQGRKIADIDADAEVNLENMYNLDMAHKETVLSMRDVDVQSERIEDVVKEVAKEIVEVMEIAKIIVDEASTAGGELNATNEKPAKDKGKDKLVEEPKILKSRKAQITLDEEVARRIEAEWNAYMKDNIDWNEFVKQVQSRQSDAVRKYQALKRKPVLVAQARKNMMIYLKNLAGFKMDFSKGMRYEEIRPLFEEEYNKVQTLFNKDPEMDAEKIKALRKRTRKEKVEKDQPVKKKKGDELEQDNAKKQNLEEQKEAEELKKNLEIVPDDEDDVFVNVTPLSSKPPTIMDYKIYKEGKKEYI